MSDVISRNPREGFSDLAVKGGELQESQKGYSPLFEGAVKTSNVLLQMVATIAQALAMAPSR